MQRLASLFELLGAGSNGIAFEQFEAELTRLMAVPELREALSPARGFLALERRGPGYFMQCALDTPGTPLFDAAVAHLAVWKGRVLVHAPLELPPLKVGAIAVADKAVLIGHDLGVTTLDRMTLEVQRTLPLKGSPRHILEWIDLEAPSPNIQRVALAGTAGRFVAADGATGRVLWVEGSDVMLLHAREDRREVFPLPETQNVAFLSDGSAGAETDRQWRLLSPSRSTSLEPRRVSFQGLHTNVHDARSGDELHVWTKTHQCVCPLGKGDFDLLADAGDVVFVASSKKPATVHAIRFFDASTRGLVTTVDT